MVDIWGNDTQFKRFNTPDKPVILALWHGKDIPSL